MTIAIIGSGMAGLAAAHKLSEASAPAEVFEAELEWGGHTRSFAREGFVFDDGPHVSFTKDDAVRDLFTRGAGDVVEFAASITNYFRGRWITHPAQCHLYGLDPELVTDCIADFVRAQASPPSVETYADWCVAMFGKTFAENFPFAYTRKYWTVEAADLTVDWVGKRMYPPKLEEVLRGALAPDQEGDFHYLSKFRYPRHGGYQSFMRAMYRPELVRLGKRVTRVDPRERTLAFSDGCTATYDRLVSTMPLPDLVLAVDPAQVPTTVRAAAEQLLCTSLVLVDVAVKRAELSRHHWFYVYDEDISFARGHFPHMLSPENAPPGSGSIQLEVYHSKYRPLPVPVPRLADLVVDDLCRIGLLRDRSEVLWARSREVKYANVVFDKKRSPALAVIEPWLASLGIVTAGRYGEWAYLWTDDSVRSGFRAAENVLSDRANQ